jgi:hypothetical protein
LLGRRATRGNARISSGAFDAPQSFKKIVDLVVKTLVFRLIAGE